MELPNKNDKIVIETESKQRFGATVFGFLSDQKGQKTHITVFEFCGIHTNQDINKIKIL